MEIGLERYKCFIKHETRIASEPGGWTFIYGPPNSGKTTLLEAIALLLLPGVPRGTLIGAYLSPPENEARIWTEDRQIVFGDCGYSCLGWTPPDRFVTIYSPMRSYQLSRDNRFERVASCVTSYAPQGVSELLDPKLWLNGLALEHAQTGDPWWPFIRSVFAPRDLDFDNKTRLCVDGVPFDKHGSAMRDMIGLIVDIIASWRHWAGKDAKPEQIEGTVLIDRPDMHLNVFYFREFLYALQERMPRLNFVVTLCDDNCYINWIRSQDMTMRLIRRSS